MQYPFMVKIRRKLKLINSIIYIYAPPIVHFIPNYKREHTSPKVCYSKNTSVLIIIQPVLEVIVRTINHVTKKGSERKN